MLVTARTSPNACDFALVVMLGLFRLRTSKRAVPTSMA